jgi:Zn-dependent protease
VFPEAGGMTGSGLASLAVWIVPIVLAVTLHEAAHGYVALLFGDRTAWERGRISLNPLRHVDPIGTVVFPAIALLLGGPIFGWAKPVPVDFRRLRHPKQDMIFVALAGPATNLLLATLSMALGRVVEFLPEPAASFAGDVLVASVWINVFLALFNMLPVPPLDGGRVLVGLLPLPLARVVARLEPFGLLIVIGLFVLLPSLLGPAGQEYDPFRWLVSRPARWLVEHMARLFGAS